MRVRRFGYLQRLARERGYGVGRRGREVLWWRNHDPSVVYTSSGVNDALEDILLDSSSGKPRVFGTNAATGERA